MELVLGHFPDGDPESERQAADAWSDSANRLVEVVERLEAARERLAQAVEGETGNAIQKQHRQLIADTRAQIDYNNCRARQLYDNANAVEYQQYMIIGIAGVILAQIIIDMAMPPPGSIAAAIVHRAEGRATMQLAQREFLLAMLARMARFSLERPGVVLATKGVFFGAAIGGGVPYVAQRVQIAQGHRETVDWEQVRLGAAAGAVGGFVGVQVARVVAPALMRVGGRVLGTVATGGVGGVSGGVAGGLTAWSLTGGELRGQDFATMVWTGFGSGLASSVGAGVRAARAAAYTGTPVANRATLDTGIPVDSTPSQGKTSEPVSGDGQAPYVSPEMAEVNTFGRDLEGVLRRNIPAGPHPDADFSNSRPRVPGRLRPTSIEELGSMADAEHLEMLKGLDQGGGTASPRKGPDQEPGSPYSQSHSSSPNWPSSLPADSGWWRAWDITQMHSTITTADPPQHGVGGPMSASNRVEPGGTQLRLERTGTDVITDAPITPPDPFGHTAEILVFKDGSSTYIGPPGETRLLLKPEQAAIDTPQHPVASPAPGDTVEPLAAPHKRRLLVDLDFDAESAPSPDQPETGNQPAAQQATDTTPPASSRIGTNSPPTPSKQGPDSTPPAAPPRPAPEPNSAQQTNPLPVSDATNTATRAGTDTKTPAAHTTSPKPESVPSASTHPAPEANNLFAQGHPPSTPDTPPSATHAAIDTNDPAAHTRPPEHPHDPSARAASGCTPETNNPGAQAHPLNALAYTAPATLPGHTPGPDHPAAHATPTPTSPATNTTANPPTTTPPHPIAATAQPGNDDEPPAEPEEFPATPGTIVPDTPRTIVPDPREHNVWENPAERAEHWKRPPGDYVTIPGVSYPLEDEPPANAIPVIPRVPSATPTRLPADSPAFTPSSQDPDDNRANLPGSAQPRPPEVPEPLPGRHPAAPATHLDANPERPDPTPVLPSGYALEPNPETPGSPEKPMAPQGNPDSLEYNPRDTGVPVMGELPRAQRATPKAPVQGNRLIFKAQAAMGGESDDKRKKKPKTPREQLPPPPPEPPQPTPEPPALAPEPAPRPKPGKRSQPSAPLVREEFVVRRAGEAIGAVGDEGERIAAVRDTRQFVRSLPISDDEIETANLLVSETVANALRWTEGKVAVTVTATDTDDTRKIRFTVTDESRVVPERTGMPDWDAERGRGGELVALMSHAYGTTVHEYGKSTWFELHTPHGGGPDFSDADATPDGGRPGAPGAEAESPAGEDQSLSEQTPKVNNATRAIAADQLGNAGDGQPPANNSPEGEHAIDEAGNAMRQAAEAVLADYHARSGPDIPEAERLTSVPHTTLSDLLRNDDPAGETLPDGIRWSEFGLDLDEADDAPRALPESSATASSRRPTPGTPDSQPVPTVGHPDEPVRPAVQPKAAPKQYPGTPDDALDVPPGSVARGDGGQMVLARYTKGLPIEGPLAFHTPPGGSEPEPPPNTQNPMTDGLGRFRKKPEASADTPQELARAARDGDTAAFARLRDHYHDAVRRLVSSITQDSSLAARLTDETFSYAGRRMDRISVDAPGPWFDAIAVARTNQYLQFSRLRTRLASEYGDLDGVSASDPGIRLITEATRSQLWEAMQQPEPAQIRCLELRFYKDRRTGEVATELGIPIDEVNALAAAGLRAAARHLNPQPDVGSDPPPDGAHTAPHTGSAPPTTDTEAAESARVDAERQAAIAEVAGEVGVSHEIVEMVLQGRSAVAEEAVTRVREGAARLGYRDQVTKPDVARAAGISLTTVDKVLGNGRGRVDENIRQWVLTVAAEIGYTGRITRAAVAREAGVGVSTVEKVLRNGPVLTSEAARVVREAAYRHGLLQPPSNRVLPPTGPVSEAGAADVAARVGVSTSKVYRVLRGESGRDPETAARVLETTDEIGFRPQSPGAPALRVVTHSALQSAIEELPPEVADYVRIRYLEGDSPENIATALGSDVDADLLHRSALAYLGAHFSAAFAGDVAVQRFATAVGADVEVNGAVRQATTADVAWLAGTNTDMAARALAGDEVPHALAARVREAVRRLGLRPAASSPESESNVATGLVFEREADAGVGHPGVDILENPAARPKSGDRPQHATVADVAQEAGVNVATAHWVLLGGAVDEPHIPRQVLDAAESVGYSHRPQPNGQPNDKDEHQPVMLPDVAQWAGVTDTQVYAVLGGQIVDPAVARRVWEAVRELFPQRESDTPGHANVIAIPRAVLEHAIGELPERLTAYATLRYLEGYSPAQATAALGLRAEDSQRLGEAAVRRLAEHLRTAFGEDLPEDGRLRRARVEDIAQAVGVNRATVYRVLRGKEVIDPDAARRVWDAVARLGFRPLRGSTDPVPDHPGALTGLIFASNTFDRRLPDSADQHEPEQHVTTADEIPTLSAPLEQPKRAGGGWQPPSGVEPFHDVDRAEALDLPERRQIAQRRPRNLDVWFAADPDIPPGAGAHAFGPQKPPGDNTSAEQSAAEAERVDPLAAVDTGLPVSAKPNDAQAWYKPRWWKKSASGGVSRHDDVAEQIRSHHEALVAEQKAAERALIEQFDLLWVPGELSPALRSMGEYQAGLERYVESWRDTPAPEYVVAERTMVLRDAVLRYHEAGRAVAAAGQLLDTPLASEWTERHTQLMSLVEAATNRVAAASNLRTVVEMVEAARDSGRRPNLSIPNLSVPAHRVETSPYSETLAALRSADYENSLKNYEPWPTLDNAKTVKRHERQYRALQTAVSRYQAANTEFHHRESQIDGFTQLDAVDGGGVRGDEQQPEPGDIQDSSTVPHQLPPAREASEGGQVPGSPTPRDRAASNEITIGREEWELGHLEIRSLLPGHWPNAPHQPLAVRLISALLDDAFRHSRSARIKISVHYADLHCTVTAQGRTLPTPDVPGPQDSWVPELERVAWSWGFALRRKPPGREVSFVLEQDDYLPTQKPDWWAGVHINASSERGPLDLRTGVRIRRDQRQLVAEVRQAIVQLTGAGRSQSLFPELAFSALVDNVFRHTDSDAWVSATMIDRGMVRVEVTDNSQRLPALDPARTVSRGITMVDDTADGWGVELHDRGKTVWFEYNVDRTVANPDSDARADSVARALDDSGDWLDEDVLRSGTAVEVAAWLSRTWQAELVGFDDRPEASRNVARGLNHMVTEYPRFVVQNGAVVTVGKVSGGNGVDVAAHRNDHGQVFIESITVDPRLIGTPSEPGGQKLYASVVGAIGGVLVDVGVGVQRHRGFQYGTGVAVVRERGFQYLFDHYIRSRSERGVDDETAFEEWVRGQLGESVIKPRSPIHLGRRALSKRFDMQRAARAATADVVVNGWDNASDAARTLYRLLFAQLRSDPESLDLPDTAVPEFDRYGWMRRGRDYDNVPDLAAAFTAERGIPVIGADIQGSEMYKVRGFFDGLRAMGDFFPGVEIHAAGFRQMDISVMATPDENSIDGANEIIFNQTYLMEKYPTDYVNGFRFKPRESFDEAGYRFALIMVADAGSAILDDVFPALLTRWHQGRAEGRYGYEKYFGEWLRAQFKTHSRHARYRDDHWSPFRDLHLDERAALAESVIAVVLKSGDPVDGERPKPTDGQRVLYSLLMKHLTPQWNRARHPHGPDSIVDQPTQKTAQTSEVPTTNSHVRSNRTSLQQGTAADQNGRKHRAPRRPAAPPGAVGVPEDPFGDRDRAWNHGRPDPRQVHKLAEVDAVGGGWSRRKQPKPGDTPNTDAVPDDPVDENAWALSRPGRDQPERLDEVRRELADAEARCKHARAQRDDMADLCEVDPADLEQLTRELTYLREELGVPADASPEDVTARLETVIFEKSSTPIKDRSLDDARLLLLAEERYPQLNTVVEQTELFHLWDGHAQRLADVVRAYSLREQARDLLDNMAEGPEELLAGLKPDSPLEQLARKRDEIREELGIPADMEADELSTRLEEIIADASRPADAERADSLLELNTLVQYVTAFHELNTEAQRLDKLAHDHLDGDRDAQPGPAVAEDDAPGTEGHRYGYLRTVSPQRFNASSDDEFKHWAAASELSASALVFETVKAAKAFARNYWNPLVASFDERTLRALRWAKDRASGPFGYAAINAYDPTSVPAGHADHDRVRRVGKAMRLMPLPRDMIVMIPLNLDAVDYANPESLPGARLPIAKYLSAELGTIPSDRLDDSDIGFLLARKGTPALLMEPITATFEVLILGSSCTLTQAYIRADDRRYVYGYLQPPPGRGGGKHKPPSGGGPATALNQNVRESPVETRQLEPGTQSDRRSEHIPDGSTLRSTRTAGTVPDDESTIKRGLTTPWFRKPTPPRAVPPSTSGIVENPWDDRLHLKPARVDELALFNADGSDLSSSGSSEQNRTTSAPVDLPAESPTAGPGTTTPGRPAVTGVPIPAALNYVADETRRLVKAALGSWSEDAAANTASEAAGQLLDHYVNLRARGLDGTTIDGPSIGIILDHVWGDTEVSTSDRRILFEIPEAGAGPPIIRKAAREGQPLQQLAPIHGSDQLRLRDAATVHGDPELHAEMRGVNIKPGMHTGLAAGLGRAAAHILMENFWPDEIKTTVNTIVEEMILHGIEPGARATLLLTLVMVHNGNEQAEILRIGLRVWGTGEPPTPPINTLHKPDLARYGLRAMDTGTATNSDSYDIWAVLELDTAIAAASTEGGPQQPATNTTGRRLTPWSASRTPGRGWRPPATEIAFHAADRNGPEAGAFGNRGPRPDEVVRRRDGLEWAQGDAADSNKPKATSGAPAPAAPGKRSEDRTATGKVTGPGEAPDGQLRQLLQRHVAQGHPEQATDLVQRHIGNTVFGWVLARVGEQQTAREITDQACSRLVDSLTRLGDRSIEQAITVITRTLMAEHRVFDEFRKRIRDAYIAGVGVEEVDPVAQALATVPKSTLLKLIQEALHPRQQQRIRQMWPTHRDPQPRRFVPSENAGENLELWAAIRRLATAVAPEHAARPQTTQAELPHPSPAPTPIESGELPNLSPAADRLRVPQSREEQWFAEWCQARLIGQPGQPRIGLEKFVQMFRLTGSQVQLWLAKLGLDKNDSRLAPIGHFPTPDASPTTWLPTIRGYLGVTSRRMDELIDAPPGTWNLAEHGETELDLPQVRALLRRIPDARETYIDAARLYPGLLTPEGVPAYPEGYPGIAGYIRFRRTHNNLSLQEIANLFGKPKSTIYRWENEIRQPTTENVTAFNKALPSRYVVTPDELAENFTHLRRESLIFPSLRATESFGDYSRHLRHVNNLTTGDAARIFDVDISTIIDQEAGRSRPSDETDMLNIWDRVLHLAGPWNDLADAWGYSYRMNPNGETIPGSADFAGEYDWWHAVRCYFRMTQSMFGRRLGISQPSVDDIEKGRRSGLAVLGRLRDAFDLAEPVASAARRFHPATWANKESSKARAEAQRLLAEGNENETTTEPAVPRSPDEQRLVEWCRARLADESGQPKQGFAEYVAMHQLTDSQVERWLAKIGLDRNDLRLAPIGQFPERGEDKPAWLTALRRYLAVTSRRMDDLTHARPGTWDAAEHGEIELDLIHLRALLRRLRHVGEFYTTAARHYPELLTPDGKPKYPEGHPLFNEYIRFKRESKNLSRKELANSVGKSDSTVSHWENGIYQPRRTEVDALSEILFDEVTRDEVAENFDLARESLIFPSFSVAESLEEYTEYFRKVNSLSLTSVAKILGVNYEHTLYRRRGGVHQPSLEIHVLKVYDRILHRAGPWNNLAEAWGHRYRMNPFGEAIPNSADYEQDREPDWWRDIRFYLRLSQQQFARRLGVREDSVFAVEAGHLSGLSFLRRLRDEFDLTIPVAMAARRFHLGTTRQSKKSDDRRAEALRLIADGNPN
ncbi:helix-turn-helix domain-containing protein [Nocardia sp. NBC_00508]|uniref:helix-turn-helix domain-containing protein n=1 Tax=Nocardia sp. NBC_00508 TaxID=2975992 RepID=UPI002E80A965|nr:helix-turn-helix domain-containing protein [Nocardia sp. NBC_00508]WUD65845.1 helix-turn-helix domain-containing protein [Nocardia sp. NBC_00508]